MFSGVKGPLPQPKAVTAGNRIKPIGCGRTSDQLWVADLRQHWRSRLWRHRDMFAGYIVGWQVSSSDDIVRIRRTSVMDHRPIRRSIVMIRSLIVLAYSNEAGLLASTGSTGGRIDNGWRKHQLVFTKRRYTIETGKTDAKWKPSWVDCITISDCWKSWSHTPRKQKNM